MVATVYIYSTLNKIVLQIKVFLHYYVLCQVLALTPPSLEALVAGAGELVLMRRLGACVVET